MKALRLQFMRLLAAASVALCLLSAGARAQQQTPPDAQDEDEVVRVNAELVQTGVTVFGKQGHFSFEVH